MEELKEGSTYLLKYMNMDDLASATVLHVTANAYHIRWNLGLKSEDKWVEKKIIDEKYTVIENITGIISNTGDDVKAKKYIPCWICKGTGTIPDKSLTNGSPCPACHGEKLLLDTREEPKF